MDYMFVYGLAAGIIFMGILMLLTWPWKQKPGKDFDGTFEVNFSDPRKDLCNLSLNTDLESLCKKHHMLLEVQIIGTPESELKTE